ncbi:hypothetical protein [Gordonia rubripertincta]|nr:hypothetical protein [Gordonia rubripertincta]
MIVYEKPAEYRGTIEVYQEGVWRLVIHDRHGNIEHIGAVY